MRGSSKLGNVSAMPRDRFNLRKLLSYCVRSGGTSDVSGVTGVSLVSADTREARTQGGRIATLFGQLRTPNHAVLAATSGMAVSPGPSLGPPSREVGSMKRLRKVLISAIAFVLALVVLFVPVSAAVAAPAPAWKMSVIPLPTNFAPGDKGEYLIVATNVGGAPTSGPVTMTDTLPVGVDSDRSH